MLFLMKQDCISEVLDTKVQASVVFAVLFNVLSLDWRTYHDPLEKFGRDKLLLFF